MARTTRDVSPEPMVRGREDPSPARVCCGMPPHRSRNPCASLKARIEVVPRLIAIQRRSVRRRGPSSTARGAAMTRSVFPASTCSQSHEIWSTCLPSVTSWCPLRLTIRYPWPFELFVHVGPSAGVELPIVVHGLARRDGRELAGSEVSEQLVLGRFVQRWIRNSPFVDELPVIHVRRPPLIGIHHFPVVAQIHTESPIGVVRHAKMNEEVRMARLLVQRALHLNGGQLALFQQLPRLVGPRVFRNRAG